MEVGGDVSKLNNISNPFQNTSKCFLIKKNQVCCVALRNLQLPPWVTVFCATQQILNLYSTSKKHKAFLSYYNDTYKHLQTEMKISPIRLSDQTISLWVGVCTPPQQNIFPSFFRLTKNQF